MKINIHNLIFNAVIASAMILAVPSTAQAPRKSPNFGNGNNREQSSDNNSRRNDRPSSNDRRQNNNNRPGNNNNRPGNNNNRPVNNRPDNNNNNNRHDNNNRFGNNNRPGNNRHDNMPNQPSRPGGNYHNPNPGVNHWPGAIHHNPTPSPKPSPSPIRHNWRTPTPPPVREYRPIGRAIPRPVVAPGYRPHAGVPIINTILGVTFGTLYYNSLDYLYNKGYEIDGYADNTVYLRNVRELSFSWPDATIYYDNYGQMNAAQFFYSTSYNGLNRFNSLYRELSLTYGAPVSSSISGLDRVITWYGGDMQGYVTLEYAHERGRYYTILSYGM